MAHIHKALLEIQREIHATGIGKYRENKEQRFNFRGIDDALMAFAPLLSKYGVLISPSYTNLTIEARQTKSGGITYNARLEGTFKFTSAEDDSEYIVGPFFGEANDGQDKGVSKATSVAERNMFFLTFVVPHEPAIGGDPDGIQGEDSEPQYLDWRDAIANCNTPAELRALRKELVGKFGNEETVPSVLVELCVTRMAAVKVSA